MRPTFLRLSKASRKPLTSKRGNKDFYKGTGVARLPGAHRTGAPGTHTKHGGYVVTDERARVFIAPPLSVLNQSPLKPYVHVGVDAPRRSPAKLPLTATGIDGAKYAAIIEEHSYTSLGLVPPYKQAPSPVKNAIAVVPTPGSKLTVQ